MKYFLLTSLSHVLYAMFLVKLFQMFAKNNLNGKSHLELFKKNYFDSFRVTEINTHTFKSIV